MTPKEMTALAREYAEQTDGSSADIAYIKAIAENALRFLLRRYCLVKKEVVRKEYESVKDTPEECNYEELGATWDEWPYLSRFYDEGYKLGQKDAIESLFPYLGKEVEG